MADHGDVADHRLRALLAASRTIVADLDLEVVLRRIVRSAVDLVGAPYGALIVVAEDGVVEDVVQVGPRRDDAESLRERPEGRHLVPLGDGVAEASLRVALRVRDEAYGHLALARSDDDPFTAPDEELVQALAASAGVAIENARLFTEARVRQEWLAASTDVTRRVLEVDDGGALRLIASRVHGLAASDLTTVVIPVDSELLVAVAEGEDAAALEGTRYAATGTLSELVVRSGRPVRLADASTTDSVDGSTIYLAGERDVGPVMVLPLLGREDVRGTLVLMRGPHRRPFSQVEAEMATTLANHASVALELSEARRDQQRVLLLEDRARIARDLHDHVIQQVFAAGLVVQATAARLRGHAVVQDLQGVVDNLDDAIKQIRVSIFQLQPPVPGGLRAAVMDVVREVRPGLGFEPRVDLDGPLDSVATPDLVGDVTAVVREALVNVARHASATAALLSLHATTTRLTVTISDDGRGVAEGGRRSGLDNMRARAEGRSGSMVIAEVPDLGGTTLVWTVPIG